MKTLEQIKDNYALYMGYKDWSEFIYSTDCPDIVDKEYDEVVKQYATEYAREALRLASEKDGLTLTLKYVCVESILSESNLPKLR